MKKQGVRGEWLLLLCSIIWGSGFIAQRQGMHYFGPFTFIAIRFLLGALFVALFIWFKTKRANSTANIGPVAQESAKAHPSRLLLFGSLACGLALFGGTSLQQLGLISTTASKAGFITTLYIIFVAVFGVFFGKKPGLRIWIAILISVIGFYFLSIKSGFTIALGDLTIFIGSIVWACHILLVDYFSPRVDSLKLALGQFFVTGLLSTIVAIVREGFVLPSLSINWWAVLYSGIIVVGIAFTLQVLGQVGVKPSVSALILSLESVFALVFGVLILHESLTLREACGCLLVAVAVILVQVKFPAKKTKLNHPAA